MMKLFGKKRKRTKTGPRTEQLAGKIAHRILTVQVRVATFLNERTKHFSRKKTLFLLIIFSLLFGAVNIWLLIGSIINK